MQHSRRSKWIVTACALLLLAVVAGLAYSLLRDPLQPQTVTREMRCPVCGMYPSLNPEWVSQIVFTDGEMLAFDSVIEMLRYLHDMPRYGKGRQAAEIARMYVANYAHPGWLLAEEAFFATGSRVVGPMCGDNYPAFATREAAEVFFNGAGGQVLRYAEIAARLTAAP